MIITLLALHVCYEKFQMQLVRNRLVGYRGVREGYNESKIRIGQ